jgi:2-dehydro-3-deoxyphosphogluconate aldolase/(4S)-4-hydroxy-2-oxoglutarate aldolase
MTLRTRLGTTKLIPVVTIADARGAVPLARALLAGGIGAIEVTLRTPAAWDAARAIAAEVPEMILGIGTVLAPGQLEQARAIGAAFAVSPGSTPALRRAARDLGIDYLPGIGTPSEAMTAREEGFTTLKYFPAEVYGGLTGLKHMAPLFEDLAFCPTGGISAANAKEFLALPNVFAVGGSWMAPKPSIDAGDWTGIADKARAAIAALA